MRLCLVLALKCTQTEFGSFFFLIDMECWTVEGMGYFPFPLTERVNLLGQSPKLSAPS